MPMFKVTLSRHTPPKRGPMYNPFLVRDITSPAYTGGTTTYRTWEFEAKNVAEVKKLLKEAMDQRLPNVEGFELANIELATSAPDRGRA